MTDEKPLVQNGVTLELDAPLRHIDGEMFLSGEPNPQDPQKPLPLTVRRYLKLVFNRARKEDDVIGLYALGIMIGQHKESVITLDGANLQMLRRIVKADHIITEKGEQIETSPVVRGQVLRMLGGAA